MLKFQEISLKKSSAEPDERHIFPNSGHPGIAECGPGDRGGDLAGHLRPDPVAGPDRVYDEDDVCSRSDGAGTGIRLSFRNPSG